MPKKRRIGSAPVIADSLSVSLSQVHPYSKNSRKISEKQLELLKRDIEQLGDLSGIVHDLNSGEVICGNQRLSVFKDIFDAEAVTIVKEYDEPTSTGTVAQGYILNNNEQFSFRQVRWTPEQCAKANIVANKSGGEFDMDAVLGNFSKIDLLDWGFSESELNLDLPSIDLPDLNNILTDFATPSKVPTKEPLQAPPNGDAEISPAETDVLRENAGSEEVQKSPAVEHEIDETIETKHKCPRCGYKW